MDGGSGVELKGKVLFPGGVFEASLMTLINSFVSAWHTNESLDQETRTKDQGARTSASQ